MKAIIFDCDGVLVNSEPLANQAWIDVLKKYNISSNYKEMQQFVGKSGASVFEYFFSKKGSDFDKELIIQEHQLKYLELAKTHLTCMPHIETVLLFLQKHNISFGVASSSFEKKLLFSLSQTNLIHYFSIICSASEVKNSKPAPDLFLLAAKKLNINPQDCYVIEDSLAGIQAARAANMYVVGYASSYGVLELIAEGAHEVVESHKDLLKIIENKIKS